MHMDVHMLYTCILMMIVLCMCVCIYTYRYLYVYIYIYIYIHWRTPTCVGCPSAPRRVHEETRNSEFESRQIEFDFLTKPFLGKRSCFLTKPLMLGIGASKVLPRNPEFESRQIHRWNRSPRPQPEKLRKLVSNRVELVSITCF